MACVRYVVVLTLALVLLVLVMSMVMVAKIIEFGWFEYARHFTNWSWTLQTLFYAVVTWAAAAPDFVAIFVGLTFFPLVTIVASVWVGSSVLLIRDPAFITHFFDLWPAGVVVLGNDAVHVVPVLVIVFFALLRGPLVRYGLRRTAHYVMYEWGPVYFFVYCVWQTWAAVLLVVGLYRIFFDPNEVYNTTLPEAEALCLPILVGLLVAGIPLAILTLYFGLAEPMERVGGRDPWFRMRLQSLFTDFELKRRV